jgi:hypothetical protein
MVWQFFEAVHALVDGSNTLGVDGRHWPPFANSPVGIATVGRQSGPDSMTLVLLDVATTTTQTKGVGVGMTMVG